VNYYWVYPWPVEIVNEASASSWLGPVLTFLGSVLLFAGSLIVLHRTNQAADRRAADERQNERERDFRLFQRDVLLRLGDEVVEAAIETWDQFVEVRHSPDPLTDEPFAEIDVWNRKIAGNVVRLSLISADQTSKCCIALRDAIDDPELRKAILELDVVDRDTVRAQLHGKEAERLARQQELRTEFARLMKSLDDARNAFSESVQRELPRTN
jgi:hypothetical protein